MPEWWTYHLSDFLLFTPRTYSRLFDFGRRDRRRPQARPAFRAGAPPPRLDSRNAGVV